MIALTGAEVHLRTGAWYSEQQLPLRFPPQWPVRTLWPRTPPPISDAQIAEALEHPVLQPPLRDLCRGKSRPLLIVDDLSRPTPTACVIPFLLRHFKQANIPAEQVTILMATGMHGAPPADAIRKKVGSEAAASCRLIVHDATRGVKKLGRTSFGTPVYVNREVVRSDVVIGIGGVYPSCNTGFGGGSKLVLGILGQASIFRLHSFHADVGWGVWQPECSFRKDLDEIADMIGLRSIVCLHVDAEREIVRISCGDVHTVFQEGAAFSRKVYGTVAPGDSDAVICNAYPWDISLFFARAKAGNPFSRCKPGASRILVASCSEGVGYHGLFSPTSPLQGPLRQLAMRLSVLTPGEITSRIARRLRKPKVARKTVAVVLQQAEPRHPIWLYRPGAQSPKLPSPIAGTEVQASWREILTRVQAEQGGRKHLKVIIYPCSPLQFLDLE